MADARAIGRPTGKCRMRRSVERMDDYFDISRKIVANMTSESWRSIPHVSVLLEADVGLLLMLLNDYNQEHEEKISLNSAMVKLIAEGLRANPKLNGHVHYNRWLVSGKTRLLEHVDVSMPILYDGKMITVTLPHAERLSMLEIQNRVKAIRERIGHTDMPATLYKTGLLDTFEGLRKGKIVTAAGRLLGAKFGKGRVRVAAHTSDSADSIHPEEIRQGSVTISNMGSLYSEWKGSISILEIVPPQICAFGIGSLQKRPVVNKDNEIASADILPITIAFDHRALDFEPVAAFMKDLNEFFRNEERIQSWMGNRQDKLPQ